MRYIKLKQKLINEIENLNKSDFYLLEGKLLFVKLEKANLVKEYLLQKMPSLQIFIDKPRNWQHWSQKYETEMFFNNLPRGIEI